jgi:hypothetical protein
MGSSSNSSSLHEVTRYHLSCYFELAVEGVNSFAGLVVLCAVLLAGINLFIVVFNAATGTSPLPTLSSLTLLQDTDWTSSILCTIIAPGRTLDCRTG